MVKFKLYLEDMIKAYLNHKFVGSFMLDKEQKNKLVGTYDWKGNAQGKANFNKNMRRKLKLWLKEIPDMILILKGLPPRVIENAALLNNLPDVANFMDIFLETIDTLPVAEHESGEMRVFANHMEKIDDNPNLEGCEHEGYIHILNGKKYAVWTSSWTATPGEIHRCEVLKKHIENTRKYVDPSIIIRNNHQLLVDELSQGEKLTEQAEMMGHYVCEFLPIKPNECIPTNPPCLPRIVVEENVTEKATEVCENAISFGLPDWAKSDYYIEKIKKNRK